MYVNIFTCEFVCVCLYESEEKKDREHKNLLNLL